VIEKIKHLFNIQNVFFVLGINREQLLSTIRHVYGVSEGDSQIYLEKFVDIPTRLPRAEPLQEKEESGKGIRGMLQDLSRELGLEDGPTSIKPELPLLEDLVSPQMLALNLRSIEKVMSLISLALNSCQSDDAQQLKECVMTAAAFRVGAPAYYDRLRGHGKFSVLEPSENKLFNWAKKRFKQNKMDEAANVFRVPGMQEACRLLDMYEIPGADKMG